MTERRVTHPANYLTQDTMSRHERTFVVREEVLDVAGPSTTEHTHFRGFRQVSDCFGPRRLARPHCRVQRHDAPTDFTGLAIFGCCSTRPNPRGRAAPGPDRDSAPDAEKDRQRDLR